MINISVVSLYLVESSRSNVNLVIKGDQIGNILGMFNLTAMVAIGKGRNYMVLRQQHSLMAAYHKE